MQQNNNHILLWSLQRSTESAETVAEVWSAKAHLHGRTILRARYIGQVTVTDRQAEVRVIPLCTKVWQNYSGKDDNPTAPGAGVIIHVDEYEAPPYREGRSGSFSAASVLRVRLLSDMLWMEEKELVGVKTGYPEKLGTYEGRWDEKWEVFCYLSPTRMTQMICILPICVIGNESDVDDDCGDWGLFYRCKWMENT